MAHYGTKRESAATVSINDQSFSRTRQSESLPAPLSRLPSKYSCHRFRRLHRGLYLHRLRRFAEPSPAPRRRPKRRSYARSKTRGRSSSRPGRSRRTGRQSPRIRRKDSPQIKPPRPLATSSPSMQARLADRYKRLEEVVGRLAEVSAATDPRRAKLLREAIAQSREQDVNVRFESIVKLLQDERLSAAATNQTELQKELDSLLSLLLKADRDKELNSQRERDQRVFERSRPADPRAERRPRPHRRRRRPEGTRARSSSASPATPANSAADISKNEGDKRTQRQARAATSQQDSGDKQQSPAIRIPRTANKPGDKESRATIANQSDKQQPGDSQSGKPSDSGKPSEGGSTSDSPKSPPKDGQPSGGQPGKSGKSSPSQSPPTPGQPGAPSQR